MYLGNNSLCPKRLKVDDTTPSVYPPDEKPQAFHREMNRRRKAYYCDPMDPSGPSLGARLWRAFRNLVLFTLFLGLGAAAVYALSVMNSRTWTLEAQNGRLVVLKGRMLPTGTEPWTPGDPHLAEAYAPVDLSGTSAPAVAGRKFDDRDELDRALFEVLEQLAKPRLISDAPKDLDKGLAYVRRAERLTGLSADQRKSLKKMQQDLAFHLAQERLNDARQKLEDALEQLKLAAESDSRHRGDASLMLLAVEPQVKLLSTTLRATTMAHPTDGSKGVDLSQVLGPQIKEVFEALQKGGASEPKPPPPTPTEKPVAP